MCAQAASSRHHIVFVCRRAGGVAAEPAGSPDKPRMFPAAFGLDRTRMRLKANVSEKVRASCLPFTLGTHYCTVVFKDKDQVRAACPCATVQLQRGAQQLGPQGAIPLLHACMLMPRTGCGRKRGSAMGSDRC